jgi:hypothetical protein
MKKETDPQKLAIKLINWIKDMKESGTKVSILNHSVMTPGTIARAAKLADVWNYEVKSCRNCGESYSIVVIEPIKLSQFRCECGEIIYI